ncbi:anthranilate synthase component I family protein [Rickettsiales endosymbiont of Stachyamoeba lipophora]|uniref:anthranilate synthase component I family protein n=1 Tax=Rickettsiales endosymbiont of Stachyamoeba lipophora TaxID=2486578 RepID=UPI000F6460E3|nr:chorismate-binding protein [Rickettsiales endosymbiont of Stachyamoeba lipophora]AZL16208.1 hypothetical protein EF513_06665 [Rickettsiales endosymbiont of Stachyamoeba lipophora]
MSIKNFKFAFNNSLNIFAQIASSYEHLCFLYSGLYTEFSGRFSYLAFGLKNIVYPTNFDEGNFNQAGDILDRYYGYFSYEMKHQVEKVYTHTVPSICEMPLAAFFQYKNIIIFDHVLNMAEYFGTDDWFYQETQEPLPSPVKTNNLSSNMTKEQYLTNVDLIKTQILNGEVYQANLTRKFYGEFKIFDPASVFITLANISPAPYSAFLKFEDKCLISNSPEQFVKLEQNKCEARPIKGTAKRILDDAVRDEIAKVELKACSKNCSENLMIVDLMRNDFNRSCIAGSVLVPELFECTSYKYYHHLHSTIIGELKKNVSPMNFIQQAFPPGSMTGAPKINAIKICEQLEKIDRGIYGGIIGWYQPQAAFEFSVVIRSLIINRNLFEFQVGGAIVIDSDPILEYEETMIKAKAIATTLGIENLIEKL